MPAACIACIALRSICWTAPRHPCHHPSVFNRQTWLVISYKPYIALDDHALMDKTGQGDLVAYRTLVERHSPKAMRYIGFMLGNPRDAEDILQEAFLKVWKEAPVWKPEAQFNTWFRKVLHDYFRRNKHAGDDKKLEFIADDTPGADENLESAERGDSVRQAIARLPERQREALVLCYYDECSYEEAAEILEISFSALQSLLFRARQTLAELLKDLKPSMKGDHYGSRKL